MEKRAHIVSLIVILLLALYYFVVRHFPLQLSTVNGVFAFAALFLIGFSFLLGPLARFAKPVFLRFLHDRKTYGLWGYCLAIAHIFLSFLVVLPEKDPISLADAMSLAVAAVAILIFSLMAWTSNSKWMEKLGYDNWRSLQRMGYLAYALVLLHFVLLENGVFLNRPIGQFAIGFILVIFLLRGIVQVLGIPSPAPTKV